MAEHDQPDPPPEPDPPPDVPLDLVDKGMGSEETRNIGGDKPASGDCNDER